MSCTSWARSDSEPSRTFNPARSCAIRGSSLPIEPASPNPIEGRCNFQDSGPQRKKLPFKYLPDAMLGTHSGILVHPDWGAKLAATLLTNIKRSLFSLLRWCFARYHQHRSLLQGSVFCGSWAEVVTEPVTERGLLPTHLVWHSGAVSVRGCQETVAIESNHQ